MTSEFIQLSLVPMLVAALAGSICALPGNFLLLRHQSLMGDTVSHVVLLGVVAAFVLTGDLSTGPMLIGAALVSVAATLLVEAIRRFGRIEPGAAMGVVFTTFFALGVVVLERSNSGSVHLDVEHVLYGNLENLIWLDAQNWDSLLDAQALLGLPPALPRLILLLALVAAFIGLFWRPLVIGTFDPAFAASIGAHPNRTGTALLVLVALAAVASFEAVGAIIVIAMFICPPAAARLMTDNLARQIGWSLIFALTASLSGYALAVWGPAMLLGAEDSVSASGMIAVTGGAILAAACLWGPRRQALRR